MSTLRLEGSTRPPRAKRAYFRIASWSLISAIAWSSALSGRSPAGGSSKAEAVRPPVIRLADLVDGSLRLGREPHAGNPHRRITPLGIKGFERGEVLHIGALAQVRHRRACCGCLR